MLLQGEGSWNLEGFCAFQSKMKKNKIKNGNTSIQRINVDMQPLLRV